MNAFNERISNIGVVPVIRLNYPERDAVPLARALCAGGVPVAEVTFRAAGADTAIRLMREACPDMLVGAGTVTRAEQSGGLAKIKALAAPFPMFRVMPTGGHIYALLSGRNTREAVEFAVAASALKHSIEDDYNMAAVAEVEKIADGDGSGRIQR